ncbi:hypothetical protein [Marinilactibacillus psychrotolerans]|uniref:Uncharacterized protein n=1 Tax=Marinilactibacillus psychrotolerans TaxID=191770 RepID=A0AAV3WVA1_9LACT|nr:hypothetical protein [Marinilactibacillus psychrotolerans]GEL67602.1 hypothetical protein MPS01_17570 [Marinilactibacillus psychrotolerans]GEQ35514.1 hypothetical protein M132T_10220 [Marinilactibacillus psychrotolerans]SDD07963.1 hypothetical protein SAMN04488013_11627 [Marinilactibacillus psychrotolerans]
MNQKGTLTEDKKEYHYNIPLSDNMDYTKFETKQYLEEQSKKFELISISHRKVIIAKIDHSEISAEEFQWLDKLVPDYFDDIEYQVLFEKE